MLIIVALACSLSFRDSQLNQLALACEARGALATGVCI